MNHNNRASTTVKNLKKIMFFYIEIVRPLPIEEKEEKAEKEREEEERGGVACLRHV